MKKINIILLVTLFLSLGCLNSNNPAQINTKKISTIRGGNPDEKIAESWGRQKDLFVKHNFKIISWVEAKNILLHRKLIGGKQYHTGWLTIYTQEDGKYLVKQPRMDALREFMESQGMKLQGFGTE